METATRVRLFSSSSVSASFLLTFIVLTRSGNIDEAHKGKGDYAYAQIIRELMHKNPHFRVLALTATPGSKPEAVQELCDSLHISHIEIRDESSPDLKQHIFQKVCFVVFPRLSGLLTIKFSITQEIEQHIVNMSGDILGTRALLGALMEVPHLLAALKRVSNLCEVSRSSGKYRVQAFSRATRTQSSYILFDAK